jgi:hypothetical protein
MILLVIGITRKRKGNQRDEAMMKIFLQHLTLHPSLYILDQSHLLQTASSKETYVEAYHSIVMDN